MVVEVVGGRTGRKSPALLNWTGTVTGVRSMGVEAHPGYRTDPAGSRSQQGLAAWNWVQRAREALGLG